MSGTDGIERHDVAIVGAGPIGLLLGCLLAQRGIDVVVLERRTGPEPRDRAIGIHPAGLAALDAAGIGDEVRREASAIRLGIASCEGRSLGRLAFDDDRQVRSLPQARTEAILEARLTALAPSALRRGIGVTAIRDDGDEVEVEVEVDAIEGTSPAAFRVRCLVGADGLRSSVRDGVGEWRAIGGAGEYAMADERGSTLDGDTARLHLEPGGVIESFPLPGRGRRWVIRLDARPPELGIGGFAALVATRTGASLDRAGLPQPSLFTARQHLAEPMALGRIALAGDAAHEISPIGGQGMNVGWLDAVELDRAIAGALGDAGTRGPFRRYARSRRAAARRAMRRAAFNMAMGAPVHGARLRIRNAFIRLLTLAPLRGIAVGLLTMPR